MRAQRSRSLGRLCAWLACGLVAVAGLVALALSLRTGHERLGTVGFAIGHLALALVGALVVARSASRRIGWLLVVIGVAGSLHIAVEQLAVELTIRDGVTNWVRASVSLQTATFVPVFVSCVMLGLIFPDGHLLSRRWRPAGWATATIGIVALGYGAFDGFRRDDLGAWLSDHSFPVGAETSRQFGVADLIDLIVVGSGGGLLLTAAAALLVRLARSRGAERDRIKWVVLAGVILVVHFPLSDLDDPALLQLLPGFVAVTMAAAFAIAIFHHRLWDIDVVIRRSLIYGVLWAAIAAVHLAIAASFGLAAGARFPVGVAIALTLAATVVFEPARSRLDALANRLVFGRRPDPIEAVSDLGQLVAEADHPDDIGEHLVQAAMTAAGLAWAQVNLTGKPLVELGQPNYEPVTTVPISQMGTGFGELRCQARAGTHMDAATRAMLTVLASQAALGISHARLASRIAHAAAAERRRLERDIHDGAQQELVALMARLGLARTTGNGNATLFASLQRDVQRILADLRALAQGIHPSVLTDGGLFEAIRDCVDRLPLPVAVDVAPEVTNERPDADIEATAYFLVAEALTNTVKHAGATRATVGLSCDHGSMTVEITDNGHGFDARANPRRGLSGMTDRVNAQSGTVHVESKPGVGTIVTATLPMRSVTFT